LIIDGISYKVWEKTKLPNLEEKAAQGTLVREVHLPPAAHPRVGAYAELHTCSIPNPILMAGTIFIDRRTKYLSQQFFPGKVTAFCANTIDYQSLNVGYHFSFQKEGDDREAIEMAALFMKRARPAFMKVHLQDTGSGGELSMSAKTEPWKNDIWHPESPYLSNLRKADELLEEFIEAVRSAGVLERTALIIVGDHGQADTGWHPLEIAESSVTTMVLWGAGIRPGVEVDYAELIDIAPTISALMGLEPLPTAVGRVIAEALVSPPKESMGRKPAFLIRTMNEQFRAYRETEREAAYLLEKRRSPEQGGLFSRLNRIKQGFYDIHRFSEWPRFHSMEELVQNNEKALKLLQEFRKTI
jgi:arylsulfatase A-like enzyme